MTLVLGGARSGKSRHAEELLVKNPAPWTYIATAQALDEEMRQRIAEHRRRRKTGWITLEAPLGLATALGALPDKPCMVDCLTLWLTNLMLSDQEVDPAVAALETALSKRKAPTILVSNEVGLGIVPDNRLGREFRDEAGRLNQRIAARAGRVLLMVAGLPLTVR